MSRKGDVWIVRRMRMVTLQTAGRIYIQGLHVVFLVINPKGTPLWKVRKTGTHVHMLTIAIYFKKTVC